MNKVLTQSWSCPNNNKEDMIYRGTSMDDLIQKNSGEQLMVNITKQGASYVGTFDIVLNAR